MAGKNTNQERMKRARVVIEDDFKALYKIPAGKRVLNYIMDFAGEGKSVMGVDAAASHARACRHEVAVEIKDKLGIKL